MRKNSVFYTSLEITVADKHVDYLDEYAHDLRKLGAEVRLNSLIDPELDNEVSLTLPGKVSDGALIEKLLKLLPASHMKNATFSCYQKISLEWQDRDRFIARLDKEITNAKFELDAVSGREALRLHGEWRMENTSSGKCLVAETVLFDFAASDDVETGKLHAWEKPLRHDVTLPLPSPDSNRGLAKSFISIEKTRVAGVYDISSAITLDGSDGICDYDIRTGGQQINRVSGVVAAASSASSRQTNWR